MLIFLFYVTGIAAAIYAIANISTLLSYVDVWDEALQSGSAPSPDFIEKSQTILIRLFFLAAALIILVSLIKASQHA